MRKVFGALLGVAMSSMAICSADAAGNMKMVIIDFPPFFSVVEDGKPPTGFGVEILKEMAKRVGGNTDVDVLPIARMLDIVKNEENFLSIAVHNNARANEYKWLDEMGAERQVVATLKDKSVRSLDDLNKGARLGVLIASSMESFAKDKGFTNLMSVKKDGQNLLMLADGRIDAWLSYQGLIQFECLRNGVDRKILGYSEPVAMVRGYFITSKSTKEDVYKPYSDAFKAMRADGTYDKILAKYDGMVMPPVGDK